MKHVIGLIGVLAFVVSGSVRADEAEWKANAGLNALLSTGNSNSQTLGGTGLVNRKEGLNKFGWTARGAYSRAEDPVSGVSTTSTKNWYTDLRYDRFLNDPMSLFTLGHIGADEPAGFDLNYGGAFGFSHELIKTDPNFFKYEAGFDYTREDHTDNTEANIYSGRAFLQYKYTFAKEAFFSQDVESLFNVQHGNDVRLNTLTALTCKVTDIVALKAGFGVRFDNVPVPGKKKTDTQTTIGVVLDII